MKKTLAFLKKWLPFIASTIVLLIVLNVINGSEPIKEVEYTTFQKQVEKDEVTTASINKEKGIVIYETDKDKIFSTTYPEYGDFKKELLEKGVDVTNKSPGNRVGYFVTFAQILFFGVLIYFVYFQLKMMRGGGKNKEIAVKPDVKLSDVAGYKEVKEEVKTAIDMVKDPKRYEKSGAKMPKGMILYGSPGTGKTLIAKAIAGEADVPFFSVNGGDFIEKFVGVGASRIRGLFEEARKKKPCVIFFDEIDAIGGIRGDQSNSEQVQTMNALLAEMDGFGDNSGVFVIATTNRLETLDPALIRSGRFDLHVKVPLPSTPEERVEIMEVHAKRKTFAPDVDFLQLAKQWIGFSGADIESIFNDAAIISVTQGKESIDLACIDEAFYKKIMGGHMKKGAQKDRGSDELKLVAYHEAGHAVVGKLLETGMDVSKVTILASTTGAGGVTFFNPTKMGLLTIGELESRVKVSYAGRVAELLLFGDEKKVTTGASGDIEQATDNIKEMIGIYGMNKNVGMLHLERLGADKSELLKQSIELSKRLYDETEELMRANWHLVESVAEALLEKETIAEAELDELMSLAQAQKDVPVLEKQGILTEV